MTARPSKTLYVQGDGILQLFLDKLIANRHTFTCEPASAPNTWMLGLFDAGLEALSEAFDLAVQETPVSVQSVRDARDTEETEGKV